jgi:hypothetical protein
VFGSVTSRRTFTSESCPSAEQSHSVACLFGRQWSLQPLSQLVTDIMEREATGIKFFRSLLAVQSTMVTIYTTYFNIIETTNFAHKMYIHVSLLPFSQQTVIIFLYSIIPFDCQWSCNVFPVR